MIECGYADCENAAPQAYELGGVGPRFRVPACPRHLAHAVAFFPGLRVFDSSTVWPNNDKAQRVMEVCDKCGDGWPTGHGWLETHRSFCDGSPGRGVTPVSKLT